MIVKKVNCLIVYYSVVVPSEDAGDGFGRCEVSLLTVRKDASHLPSPLWMLRTFRLHSETEFGNGLILRRTQ